jgi:hypothetical protein
MSAVPVYLTVDEVTRLRGLVEWLVTDGHKKRMAPITPKAAMQLLDERLAGATDNRVEVLVRRVRQDLCAFVPVDRFYGDEGSLQAIDELAQMFAGGEAA